MWPGSCRSFIKMNRMMFLEGPSGIGKSAAIWNALQQSRLQYRGFFSRRLVNAEGGTMAFQLTAYDQAQEFTKLYQGDEENIFLRYPGTAKREVNLEAFTRVCGLVGAYRQADMLVLDEIGGLELQLPSFREYLYELLDSRIPCIGVLKSTENYQRLQRNISMDKSTDQYYYELRNYLTKHGSVYRLEERDRNVAGHMAAAFLTAGGFEVQLAEKENEIGRKEEPKSGIYCPFVSGGSGVFTVDRTLLD